MQQVDSGNIFSRPVSPQSQTDYRQYLAEDYFDDDVEGNTEWTEDGEQEFVAESWHELVDNWHDFSSCEIVNGEVTHWMPKPLPPSDG